MTAFMPFSFPPALTDIDRQWQQTQLAVQRGLPAPLTLNEATREATRETLADDLASLPDLNDDEFGTILNAANKLVQDALNALHLLEVI